MPVQQHEYLFTAKYAGSTIPQISAPNVEIDLG